MELVLKDQKHTFYGHNKLRYRTAGILHTSLHAEIDAVLKASKLMERKKCKMPPSTIYVVRLALNNQHRVGNSKPCEDCQKKLHNYNVKKIYYTAIIDDEDVLCAMKMC